jgi:hypothetical protein
MNILRTLSISLAVIASGKALRGSASEASFPAEPLNLKTQNGQGSLFINQIDSETNQVMNNFYHNNPAVQYYSVEYTLPGASTVSFKSDLCPEAKSENSSQFCGVTLNNSFTTATVKDPSGNTISFYSPESMPKEDLIGKWISGDRIIAVNGGSRESGFAVNDYILSSSSKSGYACYMSGDRVYAVTAQVGNALTLTHKDPYGHDESFVYHSDTQTITPNFQNADGSKTKPNFYGQYVMGDCLSVLSSAAPSEVFLKESAKE